MAISKDQQIEDLKKTNDNLIKNVKENETELVKLKTEMRNIKSEVMKLESEHLYSKEDFNNLNENYEALKFSTLMSKAYSDKLNAIMNKKSR